MVVLEGMASGIPVVATRVDGTTDVIRHEQNGLLAEPGDPESLAEQLYRLVTGKIEWEGLREAALADYLTLYSDHRMAQGVAAVYHEVLGTKKD